MIPTLPLRLRNRLAEAIVAALGDASARRELARLAGPDAARGWLEGEESRWLDPLAARARAASSALADRPLLAPDADLGQALQATASLFDAGLYFEAHEVLEPHWMAAYGEAREALQGLIQVAVGYQHLANGNLDGARALLEEGSTRLVGERLAGLDLDAFARAVRDSVDRLPGLGSQDIPPCPRHARPPAPRSAAR